MADEWSTLTALWRLRDAIRAKRWVVSAADWKVLVALLSFVNDRGECHPSIRSIAEVAFTSAGQVRRSLERLERIDGPVMLEVTRARVSEEGDPRAHAYRLTLRRGWDQAYPTPDHTTPTPDHGSPTGGITGTPGWDQAYPTGGITGTPEEDSRRGNGRGKGKSAALDIAPEELLGCERRAAQAITSDPTLGPLVKHPNKLARDLCAERTDLDIPRVVASAGRWLRANPQKAPTTRGAQRFLLGWVKREKAPETTAGVFTVPKATRAGHVADALWEEAKALRAAEAESALKADNERREQERQERLERMTPEERAAEEKSIAAMAQQLRSGGVRGLLKTANGGSQ